MPKVQSPLILATVHVCCESYKVSSMHCQNAWKLGGRNGFKLKSEALQTSNFSNQNKTNSFCVILNSQNESPHGPNKIHARQQNALCCHCCDLSNGCVGGKWFSWSSDDFPKPNVFMIGQLLKLLKVVWFLAKTYLTFLENSSRQRDLVDLVAGRCVSKFRCLCKSSSVARKLNLLDIQAICRCGSANTATLTWSRQSAGSKFCISCLADCRTTWAPKSHAWPGSGRHVW